jgi:hypothetical protein
VVLQPVSLDFIESGVSETSEASSLEYKLKLAASVTTQPKRYHPTRAARVGTPGLDSKLLASSARLDSELLSAMDLESLPQIRSGS